MIDFEVQILRQQSQLTDLTTLINSTVINYHHSSNLTHRGMKFELNLLLNVASEASMLGVQVYA